MSSGQADPRTCSKSRAGPPSFITLSAISVISRIGSTSTDILASSPLDSRKEINSRNPLYAIGLQYINEEKHIQDPGLICYNYSFYFQEFHME